MTLLKILTFEVFFLPFIPMVKMKTQYHWTLPVCTGDPFITILLEPASVSKIYIFLKKHQVKIWKTFCRAFLIKAMRRKERWQIMKRLETLVLAGLAPFEAWPFLLLNGHTNQQPSGKTFCLFMLFFFFSQSQYFCCLEWKWSWLTPRQHREAIYQI